MNTQELLTTGQAAQRLGVSISYLNKLRLYGGGPVFVKIGAKVLYDQTDLAEWIEARKHRSTSEYPPNASQP
jgi:excisionase family DNA binding protein